MRSVLIPKLMLAQLLLSCLLGQANADWPQFRGPQGNGVVTGEPLPTTWSETHNITWKVPVLGSGHSSPVVAGNQVWLTTALTTPLSKPELEKRLAEIKDPSGLELVGELSLRALCFDRESGRLVFDIAVFSPERPEPIHHTNTYASPTPIIHAGRVYVHFGTYGSAAIEADSGEVLWRSTSLHIDHQNGPGSSPIIHDNLMIAHYDGIDHQFIAALNISDGTLAWRTERSGEMDPRPELQKAYSTPLIVNTDQGPELISPAANWVYGYAPSSGKELWRAHYGALGFSTVPRPISGHGMAFVCTSYGTSQLVAVRYSGRGDVSESHVAWKSTGQAPKKPSLALVDERLFMVNDTGILTCLNALSGEELWRSRLGGNFEASPLVIGDLIYFFDQEGKTTIVRAGAEFEEVASNQLASGCHASPAAAEGAIFLRTPTDLYRIEQSPTN